MLDAVCGWLTVPTRDFWSKVEPAQDRPMSGSDRIVRHSALRLVPVR